MNKTEEKQINKIMITDLTSSSPHIDPHYGNDIDKLERDVEALYRCFIDVRQDVLAMAVQMSKMNSIIAKLTELEALVADQAAKILGSGPDIAMTRSEGFVCLIQTGMPAARPSDLRGERGRWRMVSGVAGRGRPRRGG